MNYTTNFNLNKPEGTDLYNHLTIDNPNMDIIDGAMQANKLASVGAATELVSGTVHAITRADSNQNIFKFKATGDFKAGDSITVDGVSVNAYTTGGQQLIDDAYVLSAEVLCILDTTTLWVLSYKTPSASEVPYDSVGSVKDKIDEIETDINSMFVIKQLQDLVVNCQVGVNYATIPDLDVNHLIGVTVIGTRVTYSYDDLIEINFNLNDNRLVVISNHIQNVTVRLISIHTR